ncbi:MAG: CPBP family intramembrane glutamic endopeptidase [Actinomycetota bacterium]|nr:CPBP family intramembrane glutamic endopeptidase [Actinomycetota bacterium]
MQSRSATHVERWGLVDFAGGWLLSQIVSFVGVQLVALRLLGLGTATGVAVAELVDPDAAPLFDLLPVGALLVGQVFLWSTQLAVTIGAAEVAGDGLGPELGLRFRLVDLPLGLLLGVAAQVGVLLLYTIVSVVVGELDVSGPAQDLTDRASAGGIDLALLMVMIALGAPFVEELFYRGLLLRSLERRMNARIALVVSAVVFGAVHGQVLQLPGLIVVGLVFGWAAQRWERLGPSIVGHMVFNSITVLTLL